MTGLEKILEEIKAEAKANADATLAEADKKANEIISEAEVEANKKADFIAQNTDKKVQDILERGNSSANLEKQKARLVAKQQVISTVLANSLKQMENSDNKTYFQIVLKLVEKNSQNTNGKIAFNENDLRRLPDNFINEVNKVSKGKLELSDTPVKIKSGFILIYNGIEENCSFDAIFRSKHEELTDKISALLFQN